MSSGKQPADGSSSGGDGSSHREPMNRGPAGAGGGAGRPAYMTAGTGALSESALHLRQILDADSGYGGSVADGDSLANGWHPGLTFDQPTPSHTPTLPGEYSAAAENERKVLASHVHQQYYNQNKLALGRAISETIEALNRLREMNSVWPAHYPSVQRTEPPSTPAAKPRGGRPSLQHTQTTQHTRSSSSPERPSSAGRPGPRRAETTLGHEGPAEASSAASKRAVPEPRLVTPQLAQDFSILKIDLKMGHLKQAELVHSLEKGSVAALLDGQIQKSMQHLHALQDRIDDTASKVLITGDLNAGKSTFCNALLRRQILPVDQQPCTSIFCEVLDVAHNDGVEEVHAVPAGTQYNRDDERTYKVFAIRDLEKIVIDDEKWAQCKVYVNNIRPEDESLLKNGVVDIALIDAPGLNKDSVITTANFAKQEEIDVVVFVVSAANHFTESAKEFVFNAAREKAYMFIVVNGYDVIRDKTRAQQMILKQVKQLSPDTFKESSELVHFVSSNAIPIAPPPGGPPGGGGSGGGSGSSGSGSGGSDEDPEDGGDDDDEEGDPVKHKDPPSPVDKGKGKDKEKMRDFADLEASLRRFVLEKRSRSKLAPAKTYLVNLLGDLDSLAQVNRDVAQAELDRVSRELAELVPQLEDSRKATDEADRGTDHTIEDTVAEVYKTTRDTLNAAIYGVGERDHGIEYPGMLSAFQYAEDLKWAMLQSISDSVTACEENARAKTTVGVNMIKSLGLLHLGNNFPDVSFRPENMFRRRRDALARQVDVEVELADFFDLTSLWERQEKVAGTSMALTVTGVVAGRLVGGVHWLDGTLGAIRVLGADNMRRLIIPGLIATVIIGVSYAVSSIPTSLPRRMSAKLQAQLATLDYTHTNSNRISSEVRRALKYPADSLRVGLKSNVQELQAKKENTDKIRHESTTAQKYFVNLLARTGDIRTKVQRVDLEGPAPGVAAAYEA